MSALGKYRVMEAETLEECKRYRVLIEQALRNSQLSPELRDELKHDLDVILTREHNVEIEEEMEGARKKKEGSDEGSESGGSGDTSGGGTGSGDSGGMDVEEVKDDSSELEAFTLLFYLTELDISRPQNAEPVAAATLVLDKEESLAKLHEPYELAQHPHGNFLSSLERHATSIGAQIMQLKVQPDAVDIFRRKFGYEPYGKAFTKGGASLQRVRKTLAPRAAPPIGSAPTG